MTAEETARRIRAAIVLAGLKGVPDLARRLDTPGLGQDTLYAILNGKRPIGRHELREIALTCGLPFEFFTADFATLANGTGETGVDTVLGRLDQMDQSYREFIEDVRNTVIGTAGEIQNELDAARRVHALPSQRLEEEDETPRARTGGRRRKP